jgi:hypothetical protein
VGGWFAPHTSVVRRILTIVLDDGIEFVTWIEAPVEDRAADTLDQVIAAVNAQNEDPDGHVNCVAADCTLYDWGFQELPDDTTVGQVPEPGVLFGASATGAVPYASDGETVTPLELREVVRMTLRSDETYGPRLQRFLAGPDALWEPAPLPLHDAFVSYSTRDGLLAHAIVRDLGARDLRCFLAEISLAAGRLWADELRLALAASRSGVILVTPQSLASSWVLAEVGAVWSHAKPVIPVLAEVDARDVPAPLQPYMTEAIAADDRDALAARLKDVRR